MATTSSGEKWPLGPEERRRVGRGSLALTRREGKMTAPPPTLPLFLLFLLLSIAQEHKADFIVVIIIISFFLPTTLVKSRERRGEKRPLYRIAVCPHRRRRRRPIVCPFACAKFADEAAVVAV